MRPNPTREMTPSRVDKIMIKLKRTVALSLIILGAFLVVPAQTGSSDRLNVLDYYKLIPGNALDNPDLSGMLAVEDAANGYLNIIGAFEGYFEVALFRKKDRSALLVVSETTCGPQCTSDISVFEYPDGMPVQLDNKVLPMLPAAEVGKIYNRKKTADDEKVDERWGVPLVFELPRRGRTIVVKADTSFAPSNITLYKLEFKGDAFKIIR